MARTRGMASRLHPVIGSRSAEPPTFALPGSHWFKIMFNIVDLGAVPRPDAIPEEKPMEINHGHPSGVVRREFLQVGFSGFLGLGMAELMAGRARAERPAGARVRRPARAKPRARSMILVFLTGGLSHLDSLDMKPDAPEGIRGEFRPIATSVPGIQFCEHLPGLAARADKLADRPLAVARLHEPPERDP